MFETTRHYQSLFLAASLLAACGNDDPGKDDPPDDAVFATRPSRASTIALSDDESLLAMVNPHDGSLSVFRTEDSSRVSKTATGNNPASVVLSPDGKTAYVANRNDGTVVQLTGVDGGTPQLAATVTVGAEPAGLALSPSGNRLFVAEYAQSRVSVIDTKTMQIEKSFAVDRPRALVVTNNGDREDDDETLVIAQFFGVPVPGKEAKDDGRTGRVVKLALADLATTSDITLAPTDSGFPAGGVAGNPTVKTSPNQLAAMAVQGGRVYITSVSASPEGPARFDNNVFPVVYVADLASNAEITDASGTTNLARQVYDKLPSPTADNPRFVPGELSDLDFLPGSTVAYTVARAADVMVRISYGDKAEIGSTQNVEIDLGGNDAIGRCQAPIGVAVSSKHSRAFVNCWVTRRLGVVDLGKQQLIQTVEAAPAPANAVEQKVARGERFYFTGRARWSKNVGNGGKGGEGWSSCGSCHPDGLTDNMTWIFGSGPRQTTSMDGTFSHGPGTPKLRMLNWTAINDELHDFEPNTRDVSGGLGVIVTAPSEADCNKLDKETPIALVFGGKPIPGVGKPLKELADDKDLAICKHADWDDIEAFVATIAPVHASKLADAAQVARGRQLFVAGGCANCHGGQGWTVSRRFYKPSENVNTSVLVNQPFARPAFFPLTFQYDNGADKRFQLSAQPPILEDATGPAEPNIVPVAQAACAIRNVGTFGVPGDSAGTNALELRGAPASTTPLVRAEGRAGYNVPSLYGLALGAPYLHHGQSPDLTDLFTSAKWKFHTNAGDANFSTKLTGTAVADLAAFLLSIDASTDEINLPVDLASGASFDACPVNVQ